MPPGRGPGLDTPPSARARLTGRGFGRLNRKKPERKGAPRGHSATGPSPLVSPQRPSRKAAGRRLTAPASPEGRRGLLTWRARRRELGPGPSAAFPPAAASAAAAAASPQPAAPGSAPFLREGGRALPLPGRHRRRAGRKAQSGRGGAEATPLRGMEGACATRERERASTHRFLCAPSGRFCLLLREALIRIRILH